MLSAVVFNLCVVLLSVGCVRCPCRNISVKPGSLKPRTVPTRYLGQPSPFTHPHLIKHGECLLSSTSTLFRENCNVYGTVKQQNVIIYFGLRIHAPGTGQAQNAQSNTRRSYCRSQTTQGFCCHLFHIIMPCKVMIMNDNAHRTFY